MDRIIFHCDCNSFYASVELLDHPDLRHLPVAVCGDPEKRHGIVLAKNNPAKKLGIKTGQAIWQAREKFHAVIAIVHCGLEYVPTPPPYVYDCFDRLAAAGADLVVGHHPHVPQGMTFLHEKPVFFSLGNFIFYQPKPLAYRKLGYHLHVGVNDKGISSVEVLPYQLTDEGVRRFDPVQFYGILNVISGCLEKRSSMEEAWNGFLSYYGVEGYLDELQRIMNEMHSDAGKGAAMLRNRVMTLQHLHHWNDGLSRIVSGEINKAPEWAKKLAELYFTTEVPR